MQTILIVDDSSFARMSLSRSLKTAGYQILEADSGPHALEIAAQSPPDLVTLDLLMPVMNGLETLIQMRQVCPNTKYLIVSADVQKLTREELFQAGAHEFINKPVSKPELLAAVDRLLSPVQGPAHS